VIDPDVPVSGPDAAEWLRVSSVTVRMWAHRGWSAFIRDEHGKIIHNEHGEPMREHRKLEAVDHDGPRRSARYRWTDILDAERDTRRNPRSPGRSRAKELVLV
jgi:hypothetical protein